MTYEQFIPCTLTPGKVDVYRTQIAHQRKRYGYSHWNGTLWGHERDSEHEAMDSPGDRASAVQRKNWMPIKS